MSDNGYDHLSTDELQSLLARLGVASPSGPDSPPITGVEDMTRAMIGATLAGVGERLLNDHDVHKAEQVGDDKDALQDEAAGYEDGEARLRALVNRLHRNTSTLNSFGRRVDASLPLAPLLQAAAYMTTAAEHLVTAGLAEIHGESSSRSTGVQEAETAATRGSTTLGEAGLLD